MTGVRGRPAAQPTRSQPAASYGRFAAAVPPGRSLLAVLRGRFVVAVPPGRSLLAVLRGRFVVAVPPGRSLLAVLRGRFVAAVPGRSPSAALCGRFVGAAALTLMFLLAACGVPAQDEPHSVTLPRRPLNVSASAATAEPVGEVAQVICLTRDDRLVETVRRSGTALGPQRQLDLLVAGPTPAEQAQGLTTALAATVLRVTVPAASATAAVEISEPEEGAGRIDEALAYGQIVCTLTARPDIAAVVFLRDGQPLQVPDGDGEVTDVPLTAADYRSRIDPP